MSLRYGSCLIKCNGTKDYCLPVLVLNHAVKLNLLLILSYVSCLHHVFCLSTMFHVPSPCFMSLGNITWHSATISGTQQRGGGPVLIGGGAGNAPLLPCGRLHLLLTRDRYRRHCHSHMEGENSTGQDSVSGFLAGIRWGESWLFHAFELKSNNSINN